ncbi:MAG: hypothetical protein AVDCRST_MAG48-2346 [uncultured Friedmanniella sp.]|uniref:Uncharacterized protein n=1 Tax=uncultured Friedmanniella sp. TaxID=335381 RepID=A0A6J4KWE7_9ACTN|nr:MAG: hypothetical protein AVDCRST_MAG48-2346 [uncultured Friedmanniella sp.]
MHLGIKDGGDGVPCWNRQAVTAHVDEVNRREQQVAERNPDVVVLPGRVVCYGCEVMEFDYGIKCTASLTRTRYAVSGETEPRTEDAAGSLLDVEGLRSRAPAELHEQVRAREKAGAGVATSGSAAGPAAQPTTLPPHPGRDDSRRGGLRGLFGR